MSVRPTTLYLLRHGATEANIQRPPRLQGRNITPPLAPIGVEQAELTRDFLAIYPIDHCYTSPLQRAKQTAEIICEPHGLELQTIDDLTECDVGRWELMSWEEIRAKEPDYCAKFLAQPGTYPYPDGESFGDVQKRATKVIDELLEKHEGESVLVVAHHVVNRTYLAGLLGLHADQARQVKLGNCSISIVERSDGLTFVNALNGLFHLHGVSVPIMK